MLGIGIGLILGVILMMGYKYESSMTNYEIEQKARELGMIYENEQKSIIKGVDKND